jgi:hypothetical protein
MVLAAPEFVVAQLVEMLDELEVAAELQGRVLADRMVGRQEGAELEPLHGVPPPNTVSSDLPPIMALSGARQKGAPHGSFRCEKRQMGSPVGHYDSRISIFTSAAPEIG